MLRKERKRGRKREKKRGKEGRKKGNHKSRLTDLKFLCCVCVCVFFLLKLLQSRENIKGEMDGDNAAQTEVNRRQGD